MFKITRYGRVLHHLNKKKQSNKELKKDLKKVGYKTRTLELIRIIAFILLYSSLISAFFSVIPELQPLLKTILKISGIVGSTVFIITIAITSKYLALYTIDLQLIATKLIKNGATLRKKKK